MPKSPAEVRHKGNIGFEPAYRLSEANMSEGGGINPKRYGKMFSLGMGACKKCASFIKKLAQKTDGSHCKLSRCCE